MYTPIPVNANIIINKILKVLLSIKIFFINMGFFIHLFFNNNIYLFLIKIFNPTKYIINKINGIKNDIKLLSEHLNIIDKLSINKNIHNNQKRIYEEFISYYDKYCSLYLKMYYSLNIEYLKFVNIKTFKIMKLVEFKSDLRLISECLTIFPDNIEIKCNEIKNAASDILEEIDIITGNFITIKTKNIIKYNIKPINKCIYNEIKDELKTTDDKYNRSIKENKTFLEDNYV